MPWQRVVSFILCGMIFYDAIIDNTTLLYDITTQIKPLVKLCSFVLLMSFVSQHLIVNFFLYVIKLYYRATKKVT